MIKLRVVACQSDTLNATIFLFVLAFIYIYNKPYFSKLLPIS